MAVTGVTPPPLSTDLIDTRAVKFRLSAATGQPEIIPGSLTASAPWLIWFNTNFVSQSASVDVSVLEALDTGLGLETVTALRQAQQALVLQAVGSPVPGISAVISNLERLIATQTPPTDYTAAIQALQSTAALLQCLPQHNYSIISGTHANRAVTPAGGLNLNRIYFETDRNAVYVSIANIWTFASGIMVDLAANRPADLGTSDVNFFFLASDTLVFSYWTGSVWVSVASGTTQTTGTWTAAITFGGASTGITYGTTQAMNYVKTGSTVTATVDVTLSSKGSATGVAEITGLPFGVAALEITLGCWQFASSLSGLTSTPTALPEVGTTKISMSQFGATGTTQLTDANFTNTSRIILSVTYQA